MPTRPATLGRVQPAKIVKGRDRLALMRKPWRTLRRLVLQESPYCAHCGAMLGHDGQVDHIIPRAVRPDLLLTRSNLQALCSACHCKKTNRERRGVEEIA